MILTRLYELAEREKLLEDPAFEELPVPFIVKLGPQGEYLGIEERRNDTPLLGRKKNGPAKTKPDKGQLLSVPRAHGNTANPGFARFFVDTLARVLPISDEAKSVRSRETFWRQMAQAAQETGDAALQAVVRFGQQMQVDADLAHRIRQDVEAKKPAAGDRCTFAWHPDEGFTILQKEPVRAWYRQFFESVTGARQEAGTKGICQITGQYGPLPTSHPGRISGVPGGMAAGVSLVSYDKAAFESYGLDGAVNAGIGCRAADGYLRALTALIQEKLPGRKSKKRLGDVLLLYWTRHQTNINDLMQLWENPDPAEVERLLDAQRKGSLPSGIDEEQFYCLALSGNSARGIVRDYLEERLPRVYENFAKWFHDLSIVDDSYAGQGRVRSDYPDWMLLRSCVREGDTPPDQLPILFLKSALLKYPLPDSVLAACLRRIQVETGSAQFPAARMALIKLCLNRTHCKGDQSMTPSLDATRTQDSAYVCGRLLAFLARCQSPQDFGTSAQILERYFSAASTSPRSVFPALLRLNRHHLAKIRDELRLNRHHLAKIRDEKPGFAFNLEAELDDLVWSLKQATNGIPDFPDLLTLPEQGRFALGFYHQRAEYRKQAADRKVKADNASNGNQ